MEGFDDRLQPPVAVQVTAEKARDPIVRGECLAPAPDLPAGWEAPEFLSAAVIADEPALARLVAFPPGGKEDFAIIVPVDILDDKLGKHVAFALIDDLEKGPVERLGLQVLEARAPAPELAMVLVGDDEPGAVDREIGRLAPDTPHSELEVQPGQDQDGGPSDSPFEPEAALAVRLDMAVRALEGLPEPNVQLVFIGENGGF